MSTPRYLRSMAEVQADAMLAVLERQQPGVAARLASDALRELGTWSEIRVHIASESETRGSGCSVAGIYRDETSPPTLSVAPSGSRRRDQFTALHELGHHLQLDDDDLVENLNRDDSARFEDAACDAFAARILLPDDLAARHIGAEGPTAISVAELYRASTASRAACCVQAAQRLVHPGVVVLFAANGVVSFAASRGEVYPPTRGSDQSETGLWQAVLSRGTGRLDEPVTVKRTEVLYRDGSRHEGLYGQAAACDGFVVAVITTHDPAWREGFAPPRVQAWPSPEDATWDCETCHESFAKDMACGVCGQPKCPAGHCGCTSKSEMTCTRCFMVCHRQQFPAGGSVCRDCS